MSWAKIAAGTSSKTATIAPGWDFLKNNIDAAYYRDSVASPKLPSHKAKSATPEISSYEVKPSPSKVATPEAKAPLPKPLTRDTKPITIKVLPRGTKATTPKVVPHDTKVIAPKVLPHDVEATPAKVLPNDIEATPQKVPFHGVTPASQKVPPHEVKSASQMVLPHETKSASPKNPPQESKPPPSSAPLKDSKSKIKRKKKAAKKQLAAAKTVDTVSASLEVTMKLSVTVPAPIDDYSYPGPPPPYKENAWAKPLATTLAQKMAKEVVSQVQSALTSTVPVPTLPSLPAPTSPTISDAPPTDPQELLQWKAARTMMPEWEDPSLHADYIPKPEYRDDNKHDGKTTLVCEKPADVLMREKIQRQIAAMDADDRILHGPWILNHGEATSEYLPFDGPPNPQEGCKLLSFLQNRDLVHDILSPVLADHNSAMNLSLTCRKAFDIISSKVGIWDITSGWFGNCDNPRTTYLDENGVEKQVAKENQGQVNPTAVIVTPMRGVASKPLMKQIIHYFEEREDSQGHRILKKVEVAALEMQDLEDQQLYLNQLINLRGFATTALYFGDFFTNLQLIRVPFLTVNVLELMIPQMKNLKNLDIVQCPLIHLGNGVDLLSIIRTDRPKGKECQVKLNWRPRYHQGPVIIPGRADTVGCYGVTWDNWNADTRIAVWAVCFSLLRAARKQGLDWTSPGTYFRKWLDQTPCLKVGETLKVLMSNDAKPIDLIAWVEYHNYRGDPQKVTERNPYTGDDGGWKLNSSVCDDCRTLLLNGLFKKNCLDAAKRYGAPLYCMGCYLTKHLDSEEDHYKQEKLSIMEQWLTDVAFDEDNDPIHEWNTNDLVKALCDFDDKFIVLKASALDAIRRDALKQGIDHEFCEVQVPYSRAEVRGKEVAAKKRSPLVERKGAADAGWDHTNYQRLNRHGYA